MNEYSTFLFWVLKLWISNWHRNTSVMLRQLLSFFWSFDRFFKATRHSWMMFTTGSSWSGKQHCCFSCFAWPHWGRKPTRNTAMFPFCSLNRYWWDPIRLASGYRCWGLELTHELWLHSHHVTFATPVIFFNVSQMSITPSSSTKD